MIEKRKTQAGKVIGGLPVISDESKDLLMAQATIAVNPQRFFA